jgi:hypothetical protein
MSRKQLERMRDRITSQVFGHWWVHCIARTQEAVQHLDGALAAAGVVNGRLVKEMLPRDGEVVCDSLEYRVKVGVGWLPVETGRLAWCLGELLLSQNSEVRRTAARAVVGLGGATATPELLARLAELLRDPDSEVRRTAAHVVGGLGGAAATPEFRARLAELLRDRDSSVRRTAADVVGGLGGEAATPELLARLADLLNAALEERALDATTLARLARRLGVRFVRHRDKLVPRRVADLACGREHEEACP